MERDRRREEGEIDRRHSEETERSREERERRQRDEHWHHKDGRRKQSRSRSPRKHNSRRRERSGDRSRQRRRSRSRERSRGDSGTHNGESEAPDPRAPFGADHSNTGRHKGAGRLARDRRRSFGEETTAAAIRGLPHNTTEAMLVEAMVPHTPAYAWVEEDGTAIVGFEDESGARAFLRANAEPERGGYWDGDEEGRLRVGGVACGVSRLDLEPSSQAARTAAEGAGAARDHHQIRRDWTCGKQGCHAHNFARRDACFTCGQPKAPDAAPFSTRGVAAFLHGDALTNALVAHGVPPGASAEEVTMVFAEYAPVAALRLATPPPPPLLPLPVGLGLGSGGTRRERRREERERLREEERAQEQVAFVEFSSIDSAKHTMLVGSTHPPLVDGSPLTLAYARKVGGGGGTGGGGGGGGGYVTAAVLEAAALAAWNASRSDGTYGAGARHALTTASYHRDSFQGTPYDAASKGAASAANPLPAIFDVGGGGGPSWEQSGGKMGTAAGSDADADTAAILAAAARAKKRRRWVWPPSFEEAGAAYIFDSRSGYFFEAATQTFYDARTGFYSRSGIWYRHVPGEDPPYQPVEQSAAAGGAVAAAGAAGAAWSSAPAGVAQPVVPAIAATVGDANANATAAAGGNTGGSGSEKGLPKAALSFGIKLGKGAQQQQAAEKKRLVDASERKRLGDIAKWTSSALQEPVAAAGAAAKPPGLARGGQFRPLRPELEVTAEAVVGSAAKKAKAVAAQSAPASAPNPAAPAAAAAALAQVVCFVCRRAFASAAQLQKHELKSELHKQNLAAAAAAAKASAA